MKNKISALFVLAIFIISLMPLAIADEDANVDGGLNIRQAAKDAKIKQRTFQAMEKREKLNEAKERREKLVDMKEDLLEKHRRRVTALVEKCKQNGVSAEECAKRFGKRLDNIEKLPEKFRAKLVEFEARKADREKVIAALKDDEFLKKYGKENGFKVRRLLAVNKEKARQNYIDARLNYKEAKEKLQRTKLRLDAAKKLDKACKGPASEECKKAKAELLESAKEHFTTQADIIIEMLQKIKAKITANEDISDEDEAKIVVAIDAKISNVTAIKEKIKAAQNKEELLTAARELRSEWNSIKRAAHRYASFIVSSRMAGVIVKANHLEKRLERILGIMAENGQSVTDVQPLVDQFHTEVEAAKKSFKESQNIWLSAKLDIDDATVQEAQEKLKGARAHLKKANEILNEIFKKLDKKVIKEAESEDELEDELEAEDDSENESATSTSSLSTEAPSTNETDENESDANESTAEATVSTSADASVTSEDNETDAAVNVGTSVQATL